MYIFRNSVLILLLATSAVVASGTEIQLRVRKDMVLGLEARGVVLRVGHEFFNEKDRDFLVEIDSAKSPYFFEVPVEVAAEVAVVIEEEVEVNFSESSVLEVIAANFANQVRGTIARGSTNYLQLTGGSLIEVGDSFPVSVPELKDKSFSVTITEITDDGYTLSLGGAFLAIRLSGSDNAGEAQID